MQLLFSCLKTAKNRPKYPKNEHKNADILPTASSPYATRDRGHFFRQSRKSSSSKKGFPFGRGNLPAFARKTPAGGTPGLWAGGVGGVPFFVLTSREGASITAAYPFHNSIRPAVVRLRAVFFLPPYISIYTRISFCKIVYFCRYDLIINKLAVDSGISTTDYRFLNILIISVLHFHILSTY